MGKKSRNRKSYIYIHILLIPIIIIKINIIKININKIYNKHYLELYWAKYLRYFFPLLIYGIPIGKKSRINVDIHIPTRSIGWGFDGDNNDNNNNIDDDGNHNIIEENNNNK